MSWTIDDMPDQQGRVALVTGANSGLGLETTRALISRGCTVLMACRSARKAEAARAQLLEAGAAGLDLLELDLSDLTSVALCAQEVAERYGRLDLLINNAGLMAPPRMLSRQGHELQFAVNHLGHFALTPSADDQSPAGAGCHRHFGAQYFGVMAWDDLQGERRYDRRKAAPYKLANVMFAFEPNQRLQASGHARTLAAHPDWPAPTCSRCRWQPRSLAGALAYRLMDPLQSAAQEPCPSSMPPPRAMLR